MTFYIKKNLKKINVFRFELALNDKKLSLFVKNI